MNSVFKGYRKLRLKMLKAIVEGKKKKADKLHWKIILKQLEINRKRTKKNDEKSRNRVD